MKFEIGLEADFYGVDNNYFKLDDTVFEAEEDESDGYRSCMRDVSEVDVNNLIFFKTPIARVRVEDKSEANYSSSDGFDGYQLVDVEDGHVWLVFGTDNYNDYYPSYIFNYIPKEPKI